MIEHGLRDRQGRLVSLREIDDENWRAVADVAPLDDQRRFVPALAARYLLLSDRGGVWHSLAVYADETVTGHVMWAVDDDSSHWIGGVLIDGAEQGHGIGRAATETIFSWLAAQPECEVVRLSYHPENLAAENLYLTLGFRPNGEMDDDEVVVERTV
jgi:diamine N-acetyltransferase